MYLGLSLDASLELLLLLLLLALWREMFFNSNFNFSSCSFVSSNSLRMRKFSNSNLFTSDVANLTLAVEFSLVSGPLIFQVPELLCT